MLTASRGRAATRLHHDGSDVDGLRVVLGVAVARGEPASREALGRLLRPGDLVALFGELGSGKTLFVRGVAAGLVALRGMYTARASRS